MPTHTRKTFLLSPKFQMLIPILSEIILVGLLPIVFSILRRDTAAEYGITGNNPTD